MVGSRAVPSFARHRWLLPPARGGKGGNEGLKHAHTCGVVDLIEPTPKGEGQSVQCRIGVNPAACVHRTRTWHQPPRSTGLFLALRGVNLKGARKQFCSKLRKDYICPQPVRRRAARARTCAGTCLAGTCVAAPKEPSRERYHEERVSGSQTTRRRYAAHVLDARPSDSDPVTTS